MLTRIEIKDRVPLAADERWGQAGEYDHITGRASFTVHPGHPRNQRIRDLALAPKDSRGAVQFSADLVVLRPRDTEKASGVVLLEVVNRGVRLVPWMIQRGAFSLNPEKKEEYGDGLLLKQGHVLVWLGWQGDLPAQPGLLRAELPRATASPRPITGLVRSEFVADAPAHSFSLGDGPHLPYPVSDPKDARLRLTVRDEAFGPRTLIPASEWLLARDDKGTPVPDPGSVYVKAGLTPGRIYELVYPARDPLIAGLGMAGIRDIISYFKYGDAADVPEPLASLHGRTQAALCFGASQSGRLVRHFLYEGFNQDEKGRAVFDGAWAHLAGAGRGSFNHRFAQPSRGADPQVNHQYPTFLFPFSDIPQRNPDTGREEGLLDQCRASQTIPKLFYTNTSYEYWAFGASLLHTTPDSRQDVALLDSTRLYLLAGSQHVPGPWPPPTPNTQYPINPNDFHWVLRALMTRWIAWVREGTAPPASRYPTLKQGTLRAPSQLMFPAIPGVRRVPVPYLSHRLNFGPEFLRTGVIAWEPPQPGPPWQPLVPSVAADGNEAVGIQTPCLQAPTGTYTGWNLRAPGIGAPGTLADNAGSYFAYPRTEQERQQRQDPRPALSLLYPSREQYRERLREAAGLLVARGFLLSADVDAVIAQSAARWPE